MSLIFASHSFTQTSSYYIESGGMSSSLQSGSYTIGDVEVIGSLDTDFSTNTISFTILSQSAGGDNNIVALTISGSGDTPLVGLGTTDPLSSFDIRSITASDPANIILRTNEDGVIQVGEETGRVIFAIESASYLGTEFTTKGSTAAIYSQVINSTAVGSRGSLIFEVSKNDNTTPIEIMRLGHGFPIGELQLGGIYTTANRPVAFLSASMIIDGEDGPYIHLRGGTNDGAPYRVADLGVTIETVDELTDAQSDYWDRGSLKLFHNNVNKVDLNSYADYDWIDTGKKLGIGTKTPTHKLHVDGDIKATGDIIAQRYIVSSSVSHITSSFSSGSTVFGDTLDDTHQFTGSLNITGSVTAVSFTGNGSGLTNISFNDLVSKPTLISSSAQVDHDSTTNFVAAEHFTQANITTVGTVTSGDISAILPSGVLSSSVSFVKSINSENPDQEGDVSLNTDNITEGSNIYYTDTRVKTKLNADNVVSASGAFVNNEFIVAVGTNAITSSDALAVDSDGNLGIGTSSPDVRLHMLGEAPQTTQILMEQYNDTADAPDIRTRRFRGTPAAPSDVQTGDYLFRLNVEGRDGGANTGYGSMQFDVDSNDQDALNFKITTREAGGSSGIRYKINGSGNHEFTGSLSINNTLSIPGFADVSASLASAVAGGDNLGNHTATQNLNMGGNAITSVGNVDGVDVSTLKSDFDTLEAKTLFSSSDQVTGFVDTTGTPANNQLAIFTDSDTIEGDSNLTWNGSSLTINGTGSVDLLQVDDKLQGNGSGFQFFAFNEDTTKVKFANWYSSNQHQYGMGMLWYETWFGAMEDTNVGDDRERRIGFYLESPEAGATDSVSGETGRHPNNARFYVDITGSYIASGGLYVTDADFEVSSNGHITASGNISASGYVNANHLYIRNQQLFSYAPSQNQLEVGIGGVDTIRYAKNNFNTSHDFKGNITASSNIKATGNVYATEFHGDGSNLTNLPSQTDENFTTADHSKLDGIEANADVTDTTNVTAAGALMDSEVTSLSLIKGLTASQISGAFDSVSASIASDIPTNNNQLTNGAGYTTNTGTVDTTGTPANNQIAIFTDANTVEGDSDFTWNGTTLDINGQVDIDEARSSGAVVDINNTYSGIMGSAHYALKVTGGQANGTPGSAIKAYGGHFTAGNTNGTNPDTIALFAQGHEDGAPNSYAAIFSGSAGGVVGINTLEPTVELEVSGDGKFSGTLEIGGISDVSASIAAAGSGGSGTVTEVTVGTGLDVSNGTTTPNITLDLTEITVGTGLDTTATGISLDLTEVIADDAANRLLTSDGDGTLSAENVQVSAGRVLFNPADSSGQFGLYHDMTSGNNETSDAFPGEHLVIGTAITQQLGYVYNLNGTWAAAQADDVATSTGFLAIGCANNASTNRWMIKGIFNIASTDVTGTFTAGAPLYISDTNAGRYDFSPPTTSGDVSRIIGHAIRSYTSGRTTVYQCYFNPSPEWIEI